MPQSSYDATRDQNRVPVAAGQSNVDATQALPFLIDHITGRLLVDSGGGGAGTVTGVLVATANGLAGTSDGNTATPTLTLSTTITGVLKGNGTAISAATGADLPAMTATVGGAVPTPPNNTTTFLRGDGTFATPTGGGTGDVVGPASATDTAVALFSGTTGKLIKNSLLTVDVNGRFTTPNDTGGVTFLGGIGNATTLKTGTDGTFLFDTGSTQNIKFKGNTGGSTSWGYTDGSFNYVFRSDSSGNTTQNGSATLGTGSPLNLNGATSGATALQAAAIAGSTTLTLPAATDTLIGKATTDTLTNKTYDTAGSGNSFSINGLAATANTGTGAVVRATSPTLVTPLLGTPTSGVLTNCTGYTIANLSGAGTGVLTFLATPSSANLAAAVTDETGTGVLTFATSPTFTTSILAAANTANIGSTTTGWAHLYLATNGVVDFGNGTGTLTQASTTLTLASATTVLNGSSQISLIGNPGSLIYNGVLFGPTVNDASVLGAGLFAWSDLFLASGGVINWANGNATLTHSTGLLTSSVPFSLGTTNALTAGTIELGAATDTTLSRSAAGVLAVEGVVIPSISSTNTLTNKRVTKRAPTVTQSATPTINTDNTDVAHITGLAQAITSMTTNLTGTPVEGDTLRIDITDNGTARAITWGTSFEASTVALPTTTVISTRLDIGFFWNTVTSKWRVVAVA